MLVTAAQSGDTEAFGQLMRKHKTALSVMALRHLGQREEAEDIVQQTFLQAYQHIKSFRKESKFYTWLYTIALNQIRNHVRQRNNRHTISLDGIANRDDERPAHQWAEKKPTPEESVAQKTEFESLQKSLQTLSEEQRTIFILHYFQYLPLDEIAGRLKKPIGTVKVYLHRARKAVHKSLSALSPDGRW
jgi:RNA polymerase sigma-70 factor (ECF subfamily)